MIISPILFIQLFQLGDDADREVNGLIDKLILLLKNRAATVRANAVLTVIQAQNSASALGQLIVVGLFRQFLLCEMGGVETEGLRTDGDQPQLVTFQNDILAPDGKGNFCRTDLQGIHHNQRRTISPRIAG